MPPCHWMIASNGSGTCKRGMGLRQGPLNLWQWLRRGLAKSDSSPSAAQIGTWRESFASMQRFVGALHRAGVTLVAGTDTDLPGLMLVRELELYVSAGIPAPEVLRIATWNGARIAGVADRTGSIERGKAADHVDLDADLLDPVADLEFGGPVAQSTEPCELGFD